MEPDDSLLLDFSENYKSASCAFWRSILGFLSDAFVARNVLSLDWLFYLGSYQEPDHRGHHFFLRNHAAIFSRLGSVHPSGCYLHHARFVGLFLRHRTHGDILAGHNRYSANRSLREHDHCDADAHLPGISIPHEFFRAPKSCSKNTKSSRTRVFWCWITRAATKRSKRPRWPILTRAGRPLAKVRAWPHSKANKPSRAR